MRVETPFSRLRRFEFRAAVSSLNLRRPWRIVAAHPNPWERFFTGLGFSVAGLILLVWAAAVRGPEVSWAGLDSVANLILHHPQAGDWVKFVGLLLSWLGWGLGGLILLGATGLAGWGWWERSMVRSAGESGRPLLELLPLSEAEVTRAKLQGRFAGWLVLAAVGLLVSCLATRLMVAFGVINFLPPLVDPWLVACFFGFFTLMALARETTATLRRRDQNAAAWRLAVLLLGAGLCASLGDAMGLLHSGMWNLAHAAVLLWLGVSLARLVPYPPERGEAGPLVARQTWLNARGIPWMEGVFHRARVAMLPTSPPPPWGRRLWRLVPGALLVTGLITVGAALLELLVLGGTWVWAVWTHVPLQIAMAADGEAAFAVPVLVALIVFSNLLVMSAWWPEFPPPPANRRRRSPWVRLEMRHLGFLLPVPARRRWRQGLSTYLAAVTLILPLGMASHCLLWTCARRLSGFPLPGVGPRALLALPYALLVGCMFYALAPLLRHASRVFGVNGCLLTVPLYSGLMVAEMISVRLLSTHGIARIMALIMAAWALLLLGVSYSWAEPRTWRRTAEGAPAPHNRRRAVAILLALLPSFGFVVSAIFAVMAYAAFGNW